MIDDPNDSEMTDAVLRSEIELLADVMLALAQVSVPLTQDQIDALLGLAPHFSPDDGDPGGAPAADTAS